MLEDLEKIKKGYVKFWRSFIEWEWYTDVSVKVLFIHCVLKANHKTKNWQGITIQRGSFITSLENLAFETGLSIQKIRTAIKKLKLTNEITCQSTSQYSIITVKNYNSYQDINMQSTCNQHAINMQSTTTNNEKNDNNEKNIYSSSSCISEEETTSSTTDISDLNLNRIKDLENFYGEYSNVHLTSRQLDSLKTMILNDSILDELINELSENIEQGKEKLYDEQTPAIHYVRLKKYWNYRKNKPVTNHTTMKKNINPVIAYFEKEKEQKQNES